jgi:hypothetical protein
MKPLDGCVARRLACFIVKKPSWLTNIKLPLGAMVKTADDRAVVKDINGTKRSTSTTSNVAVILK